MTMLTKRLGRRAALLVIAAITISACSGSSTQAPANSAVVSAAAAPAAPTAKPQPAKVKFALPVAVPDPGQIWAFVPEKAGYFAEEALSVEFIPQAGGGAAQKLVATGAADFSIGSPENLANGVLEGMDLYAVATVITRTIYRFAVLPDSQITTYLQLKGKKVGISALTSGAYPFAKFAIKEAGLDPEKDVEFITIGSSGPALEALRTNKVDVIATSETQVATFASLGGKTRELPMTSVAALPADAIIVSGEMLRSRPDVVVRFVRSVMKGIIFGIENPEVATDYFIQLSPEALTGTTRAALVEIVKARLGSMTLSPAQQGKWGYVPVTEYEKSLALSVQLGTVKAKIDVQKIYTNALLDRFSNFDVEQVRQSARKAK